MFTRSNRRAATSADVPPSALTSPGLRGRRLLKRFLYSQLEDAIELAISPWENLERLRP